MIRLLSVSYTHLRAHETRGNLVCRLLLEKYEEVSSETLDYPITALGGISDPAISKANLEGWQARTTAKLTLHEFPGNHFFIDEEREAVIAAITNDLAHSL